MDKENSDNHLFLLFVFIGFAQTPISGIVNTYHSVVEVIPAKACLRVTNISSLDVNSRVMIVQMKGASIITSTGATFGDTISLNEAGNYEIGTVCYIIGDSVFCFIIYSTTIMLHPAKCNWYSLQNIILPK